MNNLDNASDTKLYKRKYGGILLGLTALFSIITFILMFVIGFGECGGYGRSFLFCSGVGMVFDILIIASGIFALMSVSQMINPFFGMKMIKGVATFYIAVFLFGFVFSIFAWNLKSTEAECSLVGLFDRKSSEHCYLKLGQNKGNF